jgi:hypothetical protein
MSATRWVLAGFAAVMLVLSLIFAVQGSAGLWFTAAGMACLLVLIVRGRKKDGRSQ